MKNYFAGHKPSHYQMNYIVRSFILSESFFWSGFNFISPLLSIFVVRYISGGTLATAAIGVSVYMISRVIFELFSGRLMEGRDDKEKIRITILGLSLVAIAFWSYHWTTNLTTFYFVQILVGIGLGLASPPKASLFSQHLDKDKATNEWSIYDGLTFIGMSLAAALGGFVTQTYGFTLLFKAAAILVLLSLIPYILLYPRVD